MGLFGAIVRTAVNVVTIPVSIAKDIVTLGGTITGDNKDYSLDGTHLAKKVEQIKNEAEDDL
jgi:hypothetical protein